MYTVIGFTILGTVISVYFGRSMIKKQPFLGAVFVSIGFVFGMLAGTIAAFGLGSRLPRNEQSSQPVTLVAMRTSEGISGSFLVGSGTIDAPSLYRFLIRNKDGSVSPDSIHANTTIHIIEDESLHDVGSMQTVWRVCDQPELGNWATCPRQYLSTEFRVPKGSVIHAFNVN